MGYEYHGKKQTLTSGPYPDQQWPMSGSVTFSDTQGIIDVGGHSRLTLTDTGPIILHDADGDAGITLDASNNTTVAGNLEIQGNVGFYDKTPVAQAAAIADLTDNSGGTSGGDIIADITEVTTAGCADRDATENAIATLAAKVDAITLALRNLGLIAS